MQSHTTETNPVSEGVKLTKTAARRFVDLAWLVNNEDGSWTVPSSSTKGLTYKVTGYVDDIYDCTCPANSTWYQGRDCKHIVAVKTRIIQLKQEKSKVSAVVTSATLAVFAKASIRIQEISDFIGITATLLGAH